MNMKGTRIIKTDKSRHNLLKAYEKRLKLIDENIEHLSFDRAQMEKLIRKLKENMKHS